MSYSSEVMTYDILRYPSTRLTTRTMRKSHAGMQKTPITHLAFLKRQNHYYYMTCGTSKYYCANIFISFKAQTRAKQ